MQVSSKKDKFFWVSAGVEVAPAVSFAYRYHSYYFYKSSTYLTANGYRTYGATASLSGKSTLRNSSQNLKGVGTDLYLSVPLALYIHPFKSIKHLKWVNLMASLNGIYIVSKNKYTGVTGTPQINAALGLRHTM